jgi:hypothetical protein
LGYDDVGRPVLIWRVRLDHETLNRDRWIGSDEPRRFPVRVMLDLIWSIDPRLDGTDRCVPLRPGDLSKEPLVLFQINLQSCLWES